MEPHQKVEWTKSVVLDMEATVLYLQEEWSEAVVTKFFEQLLKTVSLVERMPRLGHQSTFRPEILKILHSRHHYLYYKILPNRIRLIRLVPTRMQPLNSFPESP